MSPRSLMFSTASLLTIGLFQCTPVDTIAPVRLSAAEVMVTTCSQVARLDVDFDVLNEGDQPATLMAVSLGRSTQDPEELPWIEGEQTLTGTLGADATQTFSCVEGFHLIRPLDMKAERWVTMTLRYSRGGEVDEHSLDVRVRLMEAFDNCASMIAQPVACHPEE